MTAPLIDPPTPRRITDALESAHEVVDRAAAMSARTHNAWAQSARLRAEATRLRAASLRLRCRDEPGTCFTLSGMLADRLVTATFSDGRLDCDPRLLTVAELLVQLSERFENDDGYIEASLLGDPVAALLTLMRSCDEVLSVDVTLG